MTGISIECTREEASRLEGYLKERERVRARIQAKNEHADYLERQGKRLQSAELRKSARILAVLWEL